MYCYGWPQAIQENAVPYGNLGDNVKQRSKYHKMNINGKGMVAVQPDIAVITLGVETQNKELRVAQNENAIVSSRIISTLVGMGIEEEDIKTDMYNISPQYDYVEGKQIFRGYRVIHTFRITVKNIKQTGEIVDAAVAAGANTVSNINFTISNPRVYYNEALRLALKDAVVKAQSIESSLGVIVNKTPVSITEESQGYAPVSERVLYATSADTTTPIREGQIQVNASIKAVFVYYDRV